jgi:hypothetical protein
MGGQMKSAFPDVAMVEGAHGTAQVKCRALNFGVQAVRSG